MKGFLPGIRNTFFKKTFLLVVFFLTAPIALIASLISFTTLQSPTSAVAGAQTSLYSYNQGAQIYASLPSSFPTVSGEVIAADARVSLIKNYLIRYDSPLNPYAELIVKTAEKYDLDFRLLTAIAQQESNLCKKIPPGSYNCWGWGIHSQGTLHFSSFEEGIETVSKGLKEKYIDLGYLNPDEIMAKYTPSSPGSWAKGVNLFMSEME